MLAITYLLSFLFIIFFFNDTATTEIYTYLHTLSLHDALPILMSFWTLVESDLGTVFPFKWVLICRSFNPALRSEEHTSELQSLMRISYAVFCLKKKTVVHHTK